MPRYHVHLVALKECKDAQALKKGKIRSGDEGLHKPRKPKKSENPDVRGVTRKRNAKGQYS